MFLLFVFFASLVVLCDVCRFPLRDPNEFFLFVCACVFLFLSWNGCNFFMSVLLCEGVKFRCRYVTLSTCLLCYVSCSIVV